MRESVFLTGIPISNGIVVGKAYIYQRLSYSIDDRTITENEVEYEGNRLKEATRRASTELTQLTTSMDSSNCDKADIFKTHLEILADEELQSEMVQNIKTHKMSAETAVNKAFAEFIILLSQVEDELIAARTADLTDVRNRLLRILLGKEEKSLSCLPENVIVLAEDLLPSDTAVLDREHVIGIITQNGGATSHMAIIASGYKIPSLLGVKDALTRIHDGDELALDTTQSILVVNPTPAQIAEYTLRGKELQRRLEEDEKHAILQVTTLDGEKIQIGLNIGDETFEVESARYDYIGLFRSEFLYMEGNHIPTEEEQFVKYKEVLEKAQNKPVILRTLDIGGDKSLSYMELPHEENPFLGRRALRLCLDEPEIFKTQLRAAMRASIYGQLKIMFPMVGGLDDYRRAMAYVDEVKEELTAEQIKYDETVKFGIMIEIPSIAMMSDLIAAKVDFASIGTNDLTQYVCAADRMNPNVSAYYQKLSPAMIRILGYVINQFNTQGKEISVCGELAGDPNSVVVLAGLGLHKFSMSDAKIPGVKARLTKLDTNRAKQLTWELQQMETQNEVENAIAQFVKQLNK